MGYQCAGGIYLNLWLNLWLNSLENLAQPVHIEWEEVQLFSKPDPLHFNWFLVCPLCSCYLLLSYQKRNNSVLEKQVERKKIRENCMETTSRPGFQHSSSQAVWTQCEFAALWDQTLCIHTCRATT